MIPNLLFLVQELSVSHPVEWRNMHTGNEHTEDFVRLLAKRAHALDKRFGLNGKRGNPNDISDDALNCLDAEDGPGTDITTGKRCWVIDIAVDAGLPTAKPSWQQFTDPVASSGANVDPNAGPVLPPVSIPSYEDLGGDAFYRAMIGVPLQADMLAAGQQLNDGSSVWFSRTTYSLIAAFLKANGQPINAPGIVKKHRNEWRAILGLPQLP